MGRKKTFIKVPKKAILNCPNCSKRQRIDVIPESSPQFYECKGCKQEIRPPQTRCCVICAFSNKRCHYSLKMEAFSKNIELRI